MGVQLIIVSHSARLAQGVVELASQMAPGVLIHPVGGTDDGAIGTSFTKVLAAVDSAITVGDEVALLTDLGSATMTAETVLDFVSEPDQVAVAEGPLVEGAVAAAIKAQGGATLAEIVAAANSAATSLQPVDAPGGPVPLGPATTSEPWSKVPQGIPDGAPWTNPGRIELPSDRVAFDQVQFDQIPSERISAMTYRRSDSSQLAEVSAAGPDTGQIAKLGAELGASVAESEVSHADLVLRNEEGLHMRPAALVSRLVGSFDTTVMVNGKSASSVLSLMSLGLGQGATMHVSAIGPDASAAIAALTNLVALGFPNKLADILPNEGN